jgi:hypothetical protein
MPRLYNPGYEIACKKAVFTKLKQKTPMNLIMRVKEVRREMPAQ